MCAHVVLNILSNSKIHFLRRVEDELHGTFFDAFNKNCLMSVLGSIFPRVCSHPDPFPELAAVDLGTAGTAVTRCVDIHSC